MKSRIIPIFIAICSIALAACSDDDKDTTVAVTGVAVDTPSATLIVGETLQLVTAVTPSDATDKNVAYASRNPEVATVDDSGLITAVAPGYTNISATAGNVTAWCRVTVKPVDVTGIELIPETIDMLVGESRQLLAKLTPENPTYPDITWASTDEEVATVTDGVVTAVANGSAYITATADGMFATCKVTVSTPAAVGDFYYTDGTTSKEFDTSKMPIGIVYWIGDPTASDPILKQEHPGCVHGLVVSLQQVEEVRWQYNWSKYQATVASWVADNCTGYESTVSTAQSTGNLNKILGYNNTAAYRLFNKVAGHSGYPVTALQAVEQYAAQVPVPALSSGWYLPSIKELALLFCGEYNGNIIDDMEPDHMDTVNEAMRQMPNATLLTIYATYLSSTERSAKNVFSYDFNGYIDSGGYGKTAPGIVRPILAF